MPLTVKEIRELARSIIKNSPGGIRYASLGQKIIDDHPDADQTRVWNSIAYLESQFPGEIAKPSRGLYTPLTSHEGEAVVVGNEEQTTATGVKIKESDFYEPFAQWLKNDLGEATDVSALGGAGMKSKWGTPDVIGVYKCRARDLVRFNPEIISAEIKIDPQAPVVAFGQATVYRLFSAKTYIAMPNSTAETDLDRLESLCMLFGVGLALLDSQNKENPKFSIRVRAQRFWPDMFYVNEFAERLKNLDSDGFENLFG